MNENLGIARWRLPSVDQALRAPSGRKGVTSFGHQATVDAIRRTLAALRTCPRSGQARPDAEAIARGALRLLRRQQAPSLRRVFNLTGTVLHTNLGRAILPEAAIEAARDAMRSAVALEFDLDGAARGERDDHVRGLIRELTGAEDATIVNNNAAALLLVLNTFGAGKEAIVSRGELIEIGGSFRLPDIMARGGARLVEVGTTNRTHLKDYAEALGDSTGLILKVHTSNYLIQGFTKSVSGAELAPLARAHKVPFIHDLGSGALADFQRWGLRREPTVRDVLADADLVTFSGDKLLGGPQAGIAAGAKALVARLAANPLKRALRLDKIRLAALEAVLKLYRDPDRLAQTLPTLGYFARPRAEIAALAARLLSPLAEAVGKDYATTPADCMSQIGSGALPLETLASAGIAIRPVAARKAGTRLEALATAFRALPVPVLGRVKEGALVLDLRCLDDEAQFLSQLKELWARRVSGELLDVPA
jgi:L-seryl-tRNA(Ser) seleniumtransferase